jgi:hypothetical protein
LNFIILLVIVVVKTVWMHLQFRCHWFSDIFFNFTCSMFLGFCTWCLMYNWLLWISHVKHWRFSDILANIIVAIFKVNVCLGD